MSEPSLSRRRFLGQSASLGLAALGLGGCRTANETTAAPSQAASETVTAAPAAPAAESTAPAALGRSKVVLVKDPRAVQGDRIDPAVVAEMLAKGIVALTGAKSAEAAWKTFLKPEDVVGLKINCLFGKGASTYPEVTEAVAQGLQQAGVPAGNVIIWDMRDSDLQKAGYTIQRDGTGTKCYGTNGDYEPNVTQHGRFNGRLSQILTQQITALVNVPILKDHTVAGITAAMKNHYGSFHNPNEHHDNNCDPYIADLNELPAIRDKTRLIVCDALRPTADGGPAYSPQHVWPYGGLLLSTDPVALDYWGWRIIEARRKETGLSPLEQVGRPPRQLATAAARGLGTNDPERIELVQV
jgi:uncharacterized protein (DUF362 family)